MSSGRKAPGPAGAAKVLDLVSVGNALVDHLVFVTFETLAELGLAAGTMGLVDIQAALRVQALTGPGERVSGGSTTNTAVGVASLGGRAGFVGAVALDEEGDRFAEDLASSGVCAALQRLPAGTAAPTNRRAGVPACGDTGAALTAGSSACGDALATGRCLVLVTPDAERTMLTFLGAGALLDRQGLDEAMLSSAKVVYFDGYLLDLPDGAGLAGRLGALGREAGTKLAVGLADARVVERHRDELTELAGRVAGVLVANEPEALALTGALEVHQAVARLRRPGLVLAVTRGALGAVVASNDEVLEVPADEVDRVVDVTGAGDQFAAGFCYGVALGLDLLTCSRLGSLAAGEVVGHLGARPHADLRSLALGRGLLGSGRAPGGVSHSSRG